MKPFQGKNQQQGLALLAALLIIFIFAIMGLTSVRNAKESEKIAGADVRYGAVFEAAEQTLRRAVAYLGTINGVPKAGNGEANKGIAENFDIAEAKSDNNDFRREDTFVWSRDRLREKLNPLCKVKKNDKCQGFIEEIDNDDFWKVGIKSVFTNDITVGNYLNHIETRTFVEALKSAMISIENPRFCGGNLDSCKKLKKKSFYLVTIKATGFPPGIARTAENARENVIIQAVFVKVD